ncbi:hypothetical protein [Larkinella ripae]
MKHFPKIARIPSDAVQLPNGAWVYKSRDYQSGFERRQVSRLKTTACFLPPDATFVDPEEAETERLKLELNQLRKS